MIDLLRSLSLRDFTPPVIDRIKKKVARRLRRIPQFPFEYLPEHIAPRTFLDVGANVGNVTIAALESYPECKAISFEPVAETFGILQSRLKKYGDRSIVYNLALADRNGESEIHLASFHGANSILNQSKLYQASTGIVQGRTESIKLVKLDEISATFPVQRIDVMKIDVEGFELHVLRGGVNFIRENVDIIVMEVAPYRCEKVTDPFVLDIFVFMRDAGFTLINLYDICYINNDPNLKWGQMDCIFRNNKFIEG